MRQRTDTPGGGCPNRAMQAPNNEPLPDPGALTPPPEQPQHLPAPLGAPEFAERHDDPEQAEELERQQDA